jgi:hypothetical protein
MSLANLSARARRYNWHKGVFRLWLLYALAFFLFDVVDFLHERATLEYRVMTENNCASSHDLEPCRRYIESVLPKVETAAWTDAVSSYMAWVFIVPLLILIVTRLLIPGLMLGTTGLALWLRAGFTNRE